MAFQAPKRLPLGLVRAARFTNATTWPAARSLLSIPNTTPLCRRQYSSDPPPPPLLQKLKTDLKTAMRAKDAARLGVLRSILAATLNASKTASPIVTDAQLVALLRKTARASRDAAAEFQEAGRADLVEKEQAQIDILDEYAAGSGVQEVGADELRTIVAGVVTAMTSEGGEATGGKAQMGNVMKKLLSPGGPWRARTWRSPSWRRLSRK
ncbi:GatB/YqeY domain-containing protein [Apiospora hydei]|uniref:Altered inheritance of mitochondria protein 41 n=1 Tax=Apiospora hydei TaxID=1337664 RepID=A0ABR1W8R2_9PEZI